MSVPRSHHNRIYRHLAAVGPGPFPPEPASGTYGFAAEIFDSAMAAVEPRPDLFSGLLPYVDDLPALLDLDTEPLPHEAFDWSGVDSQDRAIVAAVLDRCDAACADMLDTEFRTITRRILAMLAYVSTLDRCAAPRITTVLPRASCGWRAEATGSSAGGHRDGGPLGEWRIGSASPTAPTAAPRSARRPDSCRR